MVLVYQVQWILAALLVVMLRDPKMLFMRMDNFFFFFSMFLPDSQLLNIQSSANRITKTWETELEIEELPRSLSRKVGVEKITGSEHGKNRPSLLAHASTRNLLS